MSYFDLSINLIESFMYVFFINQCLNVSIKKASSLIAIISLFINVTIYNYFHLADIIQMLFEILILLIYTCYINPHKFTQNCFITLCKDILNNIDCTLALLISSLFFEFPFFNGTSYIVTVCISKIIFLILSVITSYFIRKYKYLENNQLLYIFISLLILDVLYSIIIDHVYFYNIFDKYIVLLFVFVNLLSICFFIVFFLFQKNLSDLLQLHQDNLRLETDTRIQKINTEYIQNLNHWKHDMSHLFSSLSYQLQNNNTNEALEIINKYAHLLSENQSFFETKNPLLKILFASQYENIKDKNIHLFVNEYSHECPIDPTHFSIIVGNLFNNAVENCSGSIKEIHISLEKHDPFYFIEIKNTIQESVLLYNQDLKTTKEDKESHGMGIESVKLLVKKYHGEINYFEEFDYFIVRIIIPMEKGSYSHE